MAVGTYIWIIILNVNGLNAPTKRHRLAEWIQKQDSYIWCLQETHFIPKDTYRLKVRGWKNIFHENGKQKKAGVAILVSDKMDFKIKTVRRDKEGHSDLWSKRVHFEGQNDQRINPRRRHNNCKYLCTQHRSISIHNTNTNRHKRRNSQ